VLPSSVIATFFVGASVAHWWCHVLLEKNCLLQDRLLHIVASSMLLGLHVPIVFYNIQETGNHRCVHIFSFGYKFGLSATKFMSAL